MNITLYQAEAAIKAAKEKSGDIIGAIGVSVSSVENDHPVALAGSNGVKYFFHLKIIVCHTIME